MGKPVDAQHRPPTGGLTRRALLRGAAAAAAALSSKTAATAAAQPTASADYVPRPGATEYVLRIAAASTAPDDAQAVAAVLINGALPGPEIRAREGETLRVLVDNGLTDAPTSIHWHGMLVPMAMDGVPDISNAPTAPGRAYVYEFPVRQSGTYWYHSHVGFQEQLGCYGAVVIEPRDETVRADREAVVLLGDWLQRSPKQVFAELRAARRTAKVRAAAMRGGRGVAGMAMKPATPGAVAMGSADLSDVRYDAFLMNGRGPARPWSLEVQRGERIRLRIVNGGGSTYFRLRLDGHALKITHADGIAVEPVIADHLLMGMGETYDAIVEITDPGSYTLHAVAQDGSGQALGELYTAAITPRANREMPWFDGRELTYAQLRALAPTTLAAGPQRTFRLPLQGNMARYTWMIDSQAWPKADPLLIRRGERVQFELINQTMMWHPMHLHGHFFRLLQGAGELSPLKHTVNVAPGETIQIEFTADNPGNWFFHCHNVYHLEAGMARELQYVA